MLAGCTARITWRGALQEGQTALHLASQYGNVDSLSLHSPTRTHPRVVAIFDICRLYNPAIPLLLLYKTGHFDTVCALLLAGSKVDIKDTGGWTAEQVAEEYEQTQIEGILKSWAESPGETAKKIETQLVLGRVEKTETRLAEMYGGAWSQQRCAAISPYIL
eukprot:SAG31_NODE_1320_length_8809_cov_4.243398_9_plen_162_part_00